jgi:hypothetical protein
LPLLLRLVASCVAMSELLSEHQMGVV